MTLARIPKAIVVFLMGVVCSTSFGSEQASQGKREILITFQAEEDFAQPVAIPSRVLEILRRDEAVQQSAESDEVDASWFMGSEISLNRDSLPDLVVKAQDPRLFGVNIIPFWVFHQKKDGYQLVLHTRSLVVQILETRSKGFRNIRAASVTAKESSLTEFRFDGKVYREHRSWKESLE